MQWQNKVDSGGDLYVYLASSNRCVNISNEISVEEGGSIFEQINTAINTVVGGAGVVASIMNYYSDLQLTLALVGRWYCCWNWFIACY